MQIGMTGVRATECPEGSARLYAASVREAKRTLRYGVTDWRDLPHRLVQVMDEVPDA